MYLVDKVPKAELVQGAIKVFRDIRDIRAEIAVGHKDLKGHGVRKVLLAQAEKLVELVELGSHKQEP